MPINAYALVATFGVVSIVSGAVAARLVGPRHPAAAIGPGLAAFGALYLAGHRFGWSVGPTVPLYGFEVALPFDLALAFGTALATAVLQRAVVTVGARRPGRVSEER